MVIVRRSWLAFVSIGGLPLLGSQSVAADEEATADKWHFAAGAGAADVPMYPGSDRRRYLALPLFNISYGRFFLGDSPSAGSGAGAGLGVNAYQDSHWRVGAMVSADVETPRDVSNDPEDLHGLGDIKRTVRTSLFAAYTLDWLTVRTNVSTDTAGHSEGTLAGLDLQGRYNPIDRLTLSAGPGVTWASGPYMQTFFGVSAAQSAASGLREFRAGSGIEAVRFLLGANYKLTTAWSLGARASLSRLRGSAEESPITEARTQNSYGLFAEYEF
jgi:MipA family protein